MEAPNFLELIANMLHVPNFMVFTWFIMLVIIILAISTRLTLKFMPSNFQNVIETFISGMYSFVEDILGPKETKKHFKLIASLGIFIFFSNIVELVPWFVPPTSSWNTTIALAILVFVYYQYLGIKHNGVKYIKHFMGPVWWLTPLMIPVEIIGHFARILSLSVRLFGNIGGDDLLLAVLFFLVPALVPIPVMFLVLFAAVLQSFIFPLLTTLYIADAVATHHEE
jgi:F-type H+-transporting ATPase subunit a